MCQHFVRTHLLQNKIWIISVFLGEIAPLVTLVKCSDITNDQLGVSEETVF